MRVVLELNDSRNTLSRRYRLTLFYLLESEQNVRNYAGRIIQNIQPGEKTKGDLSLYNFILKTRGYEIIETGIGS